MNDIIQIRQSSNWLGEMVKSYDHPSIALFRAIELKAISNLLQKYEIKRPILDLGCGEGEIAKAIFEGQPDVGFDNWDEMLVPARKSGIYKKVVKGDARKMPFEDNSFNTVFSNCVIEHIDGIDKVLSETARLLKPGGYFIFTTPSHKYKEYLYFYQLFNRLKMPFLANWYTKKRNAMLNHYNWFSKEGWQARLADSGFELIESEYYIGKKTLYIWDKIAFNTSVQKKFGVDKKSPEVEKKLAKIIAEDESQKNETGAAIVVIARRI